MQQLESCNATVPVLSESVNNPTTELVPGTAQKPFDVDVCVTRRVRVYAETKEQASAAGHCVGAITGELIDIDVVRVFEVKS